MKLKSHAINSLCNDFVANSKSDDLIMQVILISDVVIISIFILFSDNVLNILDA